MASDIATTRAESLRALSRSRIAQLIFAWNLAGLVVLMLGVLFLTEKRADLTDAQFRNLRTQGELITNLLIEAGTVQGDPYPYINELAARDVIRRLVPPIAEGGRPGIEGPRIRVFDVDGEAIVDTDFIHGRLDERPLEIGADRDIGRRIGSAARNVERFRLTPWQPSFTTEEERTRALRGEIVRGERLNERGERVVSVSMPVRRVQAVLGVVTIESADVERILVAERASMIPFMLGATLVIFMSSVVLALFIALPMRRLAAAADSLRVSGATRLHLPEVSRRKDEIGALATSLEAMTGALADRIDANERFAADVSHEVKNPLASIQSAVASAQSAADPGQRDRMLAIVAQDVQRLDRLVTDIARASRIEAETARGDLEDIDVGKLLFELTRAYSLPADEAGPNIVEVLFKGAKLEGAVVLGQAGPLGQVFRNLIDNARSFSPPDGRVWVSATVQRSKSGAFVRALIEDQGPGIPPENLETIFERFYTQRPKGAAFGGNSGLGLSIARQIVISLGGRIYAENRSPAGARLVVELPLAHKPH